MFQDEVNSQCQFALLAFEDMQRSIAPPDRERFWYSTHVFLMTIGNISKLLWNNKSKFQKLRQELRTSLSVKENSLLSDRKFRNHYEHFDERMEDWVISSKEHRRLDWRIGEISPTSPLASLDPKDIIRFYDPSKKLLMFRGEEYALEPLIEEIKALLIKSEVESMKPFEVRYELD